MIVFHLFSLPVHFFYRTILLRFCIRNRIFIRFFVYICVKYAFLMRFKLERYGQKNFFDRINGLIFLGKWKKTPRRFEILLKKVGFGREFLRIGFLKEENLFDKKIDER